MIVFFLDIDGVLNTLRSARLMRERFKLLPTLKYSHRIRWDAECVANLNELCRITGAKLVLSSSWRRHGRGELRHAKALMQEQGVQAGVIDVTPYCNDRELNGRYVGRGREIKQWLREHRKEFGITDYLILDDDRDFLKHQLSRHIHCEYEPGLDWKMVLKALRILKRRSH